MLYAALALMSVAFVEILRLIRLEDQFTATVRISRDSLAVVRSKTATDAEKESASRQSSVALIQQTGLLVGKLALALLAPAVIYGLAVVAANVDRARLDASLMSPLVWLGMTVVAVIYLRISRAIARRL